MEELVDTWSISNTTHLGWSPAVRTLVGLSSVLIGLFGVGGNLLVMYGSIVHRAIKMERCSLIFINSLAASDTLMALFIYLPVVVTVTADRWSLGPGTCATVGVLTEATVCNEIFLMMSINCFRLWALRKTKGDRAAVTSLHITLYLLVVVLVDTTLVVLQYTAGHTKVYFDSRVGNCTFRANYWNNALDLAFLVPPLIISFVTNKTLKFILWRTARQAGPGHENVKSQRAISLVCWAMVLSYAPLYIILVLEMAKQSVPGWVYMVRVYIMSINVVINPLIYFLFNKKFNEFVKRIVRIGS